MLTKKQKTSSSISSKTENQLLCLGYSRFVSRGHTLLSLFFEGITAIIFGTLGIIISLVEIEYITDFNEYYFFRTLQIVIFLCLVYGGVVFSMWLYAKQQRNQVVNQIKKLNVC